MPLESTWKYTTALWNKVHMRWEVDLLSSGFSWQIMQILGIWSDEFYARFDELEAQNHILSWLTDDIYVPWWYWHKESGKCLLLNDWWNAWRWDKYIALLARFDLDPNQQ